MDAETYLEDMLSNYLSDELGAGKKKHPVNGAAGSLKKVSFAPHTHLC
jgi:hypothetical protein